eukprot:311379-Chlamydomonas_euryale.AAC.6
MWTPGMWHLGSPGWGHTPVGTQGERPSAHCTHGVRTPEVSTLQAGMWTRGTWATGDTYLWAPRESVPLHVAPTGCGHLRCPHPRLGCGHVGRGQLGTHTCGHPGRASLCTVQTLQPPAPTCAYTHTWY